MPQAVNLDNNEVIYYDGKQYSIYGTYVKPKAYAFMKGSVSVVALEAETVRNDQGLLIAIEIHEDHWED